MIEQQVSKLSDMYHANLLKQGETAVMTAMQGIAQDFMVSTNNELQSNLAELSFEESSVLGTQIAGYAYVVTTLRAMNTGKTLQSDVNNAKNTMCDSYQYYENKFSKDYEIMNVEQRENFINSILLPLKMIGDFLIKW
tara:strand:+ start:4360 stop:4773 length:414 start_codon:yes stop_codon:yes gene_type:complete